MWTMAAVRLASAVELEHAALAMGTQKHSDVIVCTYVYMHTYT